MYGFQKDFSADGLKGLTLEMVCFSANQVILHFSSDVSITVESSYSLTRQSVTITKHSVPVSDSDLMKIVGSDIVNSLIEQDKILALEFSNGFVFRCYEENDAYESLKIRIKDKEIIV